MKDRNDDFCSVYLDNFGTKKNEYLNVVFNFKGKTHSFTALTDVIL